MSIRSMMIGGAGARRPDPPTSVSGTSGNAQVEVSFSAPSFNGGSAITGYTVTASPGGATGTGSSSPITVTGLSNGTAYTFTVTATNAIGTSDASSASASVTPLDPPLFSFTNATFTNGGAVGRDGPGTSAARSGMSGTPTPSDYNTNISYFNTVSGIQVFTVPKSGTYELEARGASGSGGGPNGGGGYGAIIITRVSLTKSQRLGIVCGQMGQNEQSTGANGGGGGGSFIYDYDTNSLYVAAGGGGGIGNQSLTSNQHANANGTSGRPGSSSSGSDGDGNPGGSNGEAGAFGDYSYTAGPGAGWNTGANQNRPSEPCSYPAPVQRGAGRSGGFRGGAGYNANPSNLWGGFGGGGGGSGACNESGSGGGGGYSGGGVGNSCCASKGGGGGSYYTGSLQNASLTNNSNLHGRVIVSFIS